jgi:hypothetical protein
MISNTVALIISIVAVLFTIYQGLSGMRRTQTRDDKNEATQLTTVIVKLENIGMGIAEIKNELISVKADSKETRERLVIVEESAKSAHKRLDACNCQCKKPIDIGRV